MNEHERRGRTRVAYSSELECENGGTRLFARTHDVSTSGIFIRSLTVWEPGSQLSLKFRVGSTRIETLGEVCYSLPQIGMGVRFLDLKPEYLAAIERLVESRREREKDEGGAPVRSVTPSGVEPVDEFLGGVDRGHIYLVHGDAAGKSLFGIQFLIEGLKGGEKSALVIPYSPDDAVRRFARLGYDCQEDIDGGNLVIIKFPPDPDPNRAEASPMFSDLEPSLGETPPARLVFDPITNLLAGDKGELGTRTRAFVAWVRTFGAAVVLVATGTDTEVVDALMPLVKESFRFDVRESQDRIIRLLAFEKSPNVPALTVRVDPYRGVSLLDRQAPPEYPDQRQTAELVSPQPKPEARTESADDSVDDSVEPSTGTLGLNQPAADERDELAILLEELRDFASAIDLDSIDIESGRSTPIDEFADLDSWQQMPGDVFAFGEQVRKGSTSWPDNDESDTRSIGGVSGPGDVNGADSSPRGTHAPSPDEAVSQSRQTQPLAMEEGRDWPVPGRPSEERGTSSGSAGSPPAKPAGRGSNDDGDNFRPYGDFLSRIFGRIEDGLNNHDGSPFTIVSCRLPKMTAEGGRVALRLFELVQSAISPGDTITTNKRNDLVILLENSDPVSATAFVARLRSLVMSEMGDEPAIRLWSLPRPETASVRPVIAEDSRAGAGNLLADAERKRATDRILGRRDTEVAS